MTAVAEPRTLSAAPPQPLPLGREQGIDLARAACVVVVVLLHALMVGVSIEDGRPVFVNAADGSDWFTAVTWVAQVMPLFFVIGGFAGIHAYRAQRAKGVTAARFVAGRVQRLLVPAALVVTVVGIVLAGLLVAGVPGELVQMAGYRFGQPLWFLAVFLLCQALLPAFVHLHERASLRTVAVLSVAVGVVDAARAVTGWEGLGFFNLVFVWLTVQQLGFFLADGFAEKLSRLSRLSVAAGSVLLLAGAFLGGVYSPDLYENLNPPTVVLLVLGVAQMMLLSVARPLLDRLSRRAAPAAFTRFVTTRAMTIYLWHMPVLLGLAGLSTVLAMNGVVQLPAPSSGDWWWGRPLWFTATLAVTALVALGLGRWERQRMSTPSAVARRTLQAVLAGLVAIVLLLVVGTTPVSAAAAVVLMWFALRRAGTPTPAQSQARQRWMLSRTTSATSA